MRASFRQGAIQSAVMRLSGRLISRPKPSAEFRSAASRIGANSALIEIGPRSRLNTASNGNGGHWSKASQLVSTSRPIRSELGVDGQLADAAAGVAADQCHVGQVEGRDRVVDDLRDAVQRQRAGVA